MLEFRQTVEALYTIEVEATDAADADRIIGAMSKSEFLSKAKLISISNDDTLEYPTQI